MLDRFYAWCGFGECRAAMPEPRPGLPAQCVDSKAIFRLSMWERIGALVSGKVMVAIATSVDAVPTFMDSTSAISILPPNYPLDEEPAE